MRQEQAWLAVMAALSKLPQHPAGGRGPCKLLDVQAGCAPAAWLAQTGVLPQMHILQPHQRLQLLHVGEDVLHHLAGLVASQEERLLGILNLQQAASVAPRSDLRLQFDQVNHSSATDEALTSLGSLACRIRLALLDLVFCRSV